MSCELEAIFFSGSYNISQNPGMQWDELEMDERVTVYGLEKSSLEVWGSVYDSSYL